MRGGRAARGARRHGWLVLASPRNHFSGTFAKRAVETTAPLLVAIDQLKEVTRAQELAVRGALLEEMCAAATARRSRLAPPRSGSTSPRPCAW